MDEIQALSAWRDAFMQAATELGTRVAGFLPSLFGAVLITLLGWVVSRAAEVLAGRLLRGFGLDRAAARLRVARILERAGVRMTVSQIVARTIFWLLMLTFILIGVQTLGLDAVTATIDRLVGFLPNLLGAALVAALGLAFARFLGTIASSAAAAAELPNAVRLGFLVRVLVAALVLVVSAEQLGIGTAILVGPITAVLAAAGLSAGLAFALGARRVVSHILAGHFLKQSLPRDSFIEVDGERGIVERIGSVDTLFRNGERSWSVPNAELLEKVVKR